MIITLRQETASHPKKDTDAIANHLKQHKGKVR